MRKETAKSGTGKHLYLADIYLVLLRVNTKIANLRDPKIQNRLRYTLNYP